MEYQDLTEEQRTKIVGKTAEEILAYAKSEGYELSDDELALVAGGEEEESWVAKYGCPKCKSAVNETGEVRPDGARKVRCITCGYEFYYEWEAETE